MRRMHATTVRGFTQAFVHEGKGGVPLLLVHGWPETRRIWWRNIEPLAAAGFEVIAPDLRGFGDSRRRARRLPRHRRPTAATCTPSSTTTSATTGSWRSAATWAGP